MLGPVVIDASVLVAAARPLEDAHDAARAVMAGLIAVDVPVLLPAIVIPEVTAALIRRGAIVEAVTELLDVLATWPGGSIVAVDVHLADGAGRLAASLGLRGCDAVYVALAERVDAVLITLDAAQRQRLPLGVTALTPAEALAHLT